MPENTLFGEKLACPSCEIVTRHDVLFSTEEEPEVSKDDLRRTYLVVECRACGERSFALATRFVGEDPEFPDELRVTTEVFPGPMIREEMDEAGDFPEDVRSIYSEVIEVFNTSAARGLGMLLRALVEGVCRDQECKGKNLEQRIDDLVERSLLSKPEAEMLHVLRYIGNEAAHEQGEPSWTDLVAGLDILEHLLRSVYVLPQTVKELKSSRDQRKAAKIRREKRAAERAAARRAKAERTAAEKAELGIAHSLPRTDPQSAS